MHKIILVEATKTPLEQPKKNKKTTTQERKKDTQ